ncbi:MAG: rod shape-determining protein MreC [Candidatus Doudnabacteria bacterium]|nr:rod shape-determining protein MreC [Candidatus Doudnabacteria bacterium]
MRFIYTKSFAFFFGTLVVAAGLTFFHYKGWLSVAQRAFLQLPRPINLVLTAVSRPVKAFFANAYNLRQIAKENALFKEQLFDLRRRQALFDQISLENESLRKELNFFKTSKLALKPCTVLGRSSQGLADTITINCGLEAGAEVGKAVVSKGFLVGKVSYAAKGFSAVQLVSNSGFSVDARLSQSGHLAIVRGSFNSGIILDQVSQDEPLSKGMLVITAGINDKTAKSLLVGEVDEILSSPNDLFKKASLVSPIDFSDLEFVFLAK